MLQNRTDHELPTKETSNLDQKQRVGHNDPIRDRVPPVDLMNISLRLAPRQASWYTEAVVSSLADKALISSRMTDVFGVGATTDQYLPPGQYLLRVGYRF